jgi:DNA-binding response OmpR family regulator
MVVDDDPDVLSTSRTMLEQQNYEVITAESGDECLKKLEDGLKGIILIDIPIMHKGCCNKYYNSYWNKRPSTNRSFGPLNL